MILTLRNMKQETQGESKPKQSKKQNKKTLLTFSTHISLMLLIYNKIYILTGQHNKW